MYNTTVLYDKSKILVELSNENFSDAFVIYTKYMAKREKRVIHKSMFGLKCNTYQNFALEPNYYTVPQPKNSSSTTFCLNQEDKCFDKFEKLACFRYLELFNNS